ncbi:Fic family protein [Flavobacterium branchiicola]|uniref:Fic family protein n=1 Tax=Flavobacterium branchiicola TaxID=1114875 RepID=A0ABV9PI21_9FLAO|nr:Fic family protein [Flavobacterium branchiicola]MBS7255130.1 Fic family protein [Flavobacterium branchiicola]
MENQTNWTPFPDDNLLGLTDKNQINEIEAIGIAKAELYTFELEVDVEISTMLILEIHKIAFEQLYDWAGKWRKTEVSVGQLIPPKPTLVLQAMFQFLDNLNFKISISKTQNDHIECLVYAHYEFIRIHPFNNGNGRTGRILMNLIALKFGYQPLELYHREGESRKFYINAMKLADNGDYKLLNQLITEELISF